MSDTILRQMAMLHAIPRYPNKIYVSTLLNKLQASGYETTARTIQRDLNTLSATIPLTSDEYNPQGWSWLEDAVQLDMPALEPQAALTFQLVERYMQSLLPISTLAYLQPWFATAEAVLNQQNTSITSWPSKIRVLPRGVQLQAPTINPQVQLLIYQSLSQELRVNISYLSRASKEMKDYTISPLALVVRDKVIYILCTMKEYSDIRQLALHRIHSAESTNQAINRPRDFDVDAYIASGAFGILDSDLNLKLVANFDASAAAHLYETPISIDQQLQRLEDGSIKLTATVKDTLEICWWLLAFGDQVEVIGPAKLRKKMSEMVKRMSEKYD
jgi:predicted DNA-binding transcriptional regulator YafY